MMRIPASWRPAPRRSSRAMAIGPGDGWPRRSGSAVVNRSRVGVRGVVGVGAAMTLAAAVVSAPVSAGATPGGSTGPSSSQSPYLVRSQPGVVLRSIVTVGDAVPKVGGGSYRMVGSPDGLGAYDNGDGTFTVLMN